MSLFKTNKAFFEELAKKKQETHPIKQAPSKWNKPQQAPVPPSEPPAQLKPQQTPVPPSQSAQLKPQQAPVPPSEPPAQLKSQLKPQAHPQGEEQPKVLTFKERKQRYQNQLKANKDNTIPPIVQKNTKSQQKKAPIVHEVFQVKKQKKQKQKQQNNCKTKTQQKKIKKQQHELHKQHEQHKQHEKHQQQRNQIIEEGQFVLKETKGKESQNIGYLGNGQMNIQNKRKSKRMSFQDFDAL